MGFLTDYENGEVEFQGKHYPVDLAYDTVLNVQRMYREKLLDDAHITCNKNTMPNDPKSPFVTSGVRLGTPAVTSRGMKEDDMDKIAEAIAMVIKGQESKVAEARAIVQSLTDKYPLI